MIRFFKPTLKRKDMDSVLQALVDSVDEKLPRGERYKMFIQEFTEKTGCQGGAAYRTYPDCIEAALRLLGAEQGTVVAISPLAPAVYKTVLEKLGCSIVYVDADRENGLPQEDLVAGSGASILVLYENCGSLPMKYNSETTYADMCSYETVSVLEDVSESIGGHFRDEANAGSWGKAVVCACEENGVISCGGGAVLGAKGSLAYTLRSRKPGSFIRMPDMNAALGSIQLANLDDNSAKRREITALYSQNLAKTPHKRYGLSLLDFESNAACFPVFLDSKPDETFKFAQKREVPVRKTFEESICSTYQGDMFSDFPVCAAYYHRTVSFPVYPFLLKTEADTVAKILGHLP